MQTLFEFITYTKGVEYLIAVGFLLFFVFFWRVLNTTVVAEPAPARAPGWAGRLAEMIGGFLIPESLHFHPGHAWAKGEENDVFVVGVDDFGQKLFGPVAEVAVPMVGSRVNQGERAWSLQADGKTVDMLSPVDGTVVSVNPLVLMEPNQINRDPYGDGWLLRIRSPRKGPNLKSLLNGMLAKKWIEQARTDLLRAAGPDELGTVLADAGPARDGIARAMNQESWDRIVKEFFLTGEE